MALSTILANPTIRLLLPLFTFIVGMVIYSVFVFKFYRYLARRDVFRIDLHEYNSAEHAGLRRLFAAILYVIEYLLFFPLLVFFWFAIIVVLLVFLSQQSLSSVALLSMALVGAVRMTAYYSEDLSKDLAKMMPFALLGVFLVDVSVFDPAYAFERLAGVHHVLELVALYLVFVIILEFAMRVASWMRGSSD